jgi:hypothetical protein
MEAVRDYKIIARNLRKLGFFVDESDIDKDVLRVIRPMPDHKSKGFWISRVESKWYVGTFFLIGHRIPNASEIEPFCMECLHTKSFGNLRFPKSLVKKYALRPLDVEEYKKIIR